MGLKERIENHPVVLFSVVAIASFLAGLATYEGILRIAHLEVVPKGSYVKKEDVARRFIVEGVDVAEGPGEKASVPPSRESPSRKPAVTAPTGPEESASAEEWPPLRDSQGREQVEVGGVLFTNLGCTVSAAGLTCEVMAVARNQDTQASIVRGPRNGSRVLDGDGKERTPNRIVFGNEKSAGHNIVEGHLVADVPARIVLEFSDVRNRTLKVSLIELIWYKDAFFGERYRVQLRETPVAL